MKNVVMKMNELMHSTIHFKIGSRFLAFFSLIQQKAIKEYITSVFQDDSNIACTSTVFKDLLKEQINEIE